MHKATTFVLAALALAACSQRNSAVGGTTIAVIPKGTSHVFWQSIHAGAEKAAREVGATIVWRGPLREDDRDSQVSEGRSFISRGVRGSCSRRSTKRRLRSRSPPRNDEAFPAS
jgi:ABC-type sugar transport system, periplasmic component